MEWCAQDYDEAVKWYRLAAEQGEATAPRSFGIRFLLKLNSHAPRP